MIILDDVVSIEYQEKLKALLLGNEFPWYYLEDVTRLGYANSQKRPAFVHSLIVEGKKNSEFLDSILPLVNIASDAANIDIREIFRIKTFLQFPLIHCDDVPDTVHIDTALKHWVMIYYPIDCDGRTVLLNTKYTQELGVYPEFTNIEDMIVKKVEPKQGRILLFDGHIYHTAEQPRLGTRCIINFNLFDSSQINQ